MFSLEFSTHLTTRKKTGTEIVYLKDETIKIVI